MAFHDPSFDPRKHSILATSDHVANLTLDYRNLDSYPHNTTTSSNLTSLFSQDSFPGHSMYATGPVSMEPSFSSASIEPSMTHINDPMSSLNRGTSPFQQSVSVYSGLDYPTQQITSSRSISHSPMSSHQLPVGSISPPLDNGIER